MKTIKLYDEPGPMRTSTGIEDLEIPLLAGRDRLPWEQVEAARRAEAAWDWSGSVLWGEAHSVEAEHSQAGVPHLP